METTNIRRIGVNGYISDGPDDVVALDEVKPRVNGVRSHDLQSSYASATTDGPVKFPARQNHSQTKALHNERYQRFEENERSGHKRQRHNRYSYSQSIGQSSQHPIGAQYEYQQWTETLQHTQTGSSLQLHGSGEQTFLQGTSMATLSPPFSLSGSTCCFYITFHHV